MAEPPLGRSLSPSKLQNPQELHVRGRPRTRPTYPHHTSAASPAPALVRRAAVGPRAR